MTFYTPFARGVAALGLCIGVPLFWVTMASCGTAEISPGVARSDATRPDGAINLAQLGGIPAAGQCSNKTCAELKYTCGSIQKCDGKLELCGTACAGDKQCSPLSHTCVASVCAEGNGGKGAGCGFEYDACGNPVLCGVCPSGKICNTGSKRCETCVPQTVGSCGTDECGSRADGCGGTYTCTACPSGKVCDAIARKCVVPKLSTCAQVGVKCGEISNGTGGTVSCGTCPAGEGCLNGACAVFAKPASCQVLAASCGQIKDACTGRDVNCGACAGVSDKCDPRDRARGTCEGTEKCNMGLCGSCKPKTCVDEKRGCGVFLDNSCGGYNRVDCGSCPMGQGCNRTSGGSYECAACTARSCAEVGYACGDYYDSCSENPLNCGSCPSGQSCRRDHTCGSCGNPCAGKQCGSEIDDCNKIVQCGTCTGATSCEFSSGQCKACVPVGCGTRCGTQSDGCGGTLNCPSCPPCSPTTCAGGKCNSQADGCGGTLICPACAGGEVCIANKCCRPKTCADYPGINEKVPDDCGNTIDCRGVIVQ